MMHDRRDKNFVPSAVDSCSIPPSLDAKTEIPVQSLAGTSKALAGMVGLDVDGILDLARGFHGCYFETGQGSAVTNGAAGGVDMVTLEARAYGVARHIQGKTGAWTIVNDVAGFIGPEVFRTADQLRRVCLEDVVMANDTSSVGRYSARRCGLHHAGTV